MFIQSSLDKNINKSLVRIADNTHYITVSPRIVKNNSYLSYPPENKLKVLIVYYNITLG